MKMPFSLFWRRVGWLIERLAHVAMAVCVAGMLGLGVLLAAVGRWLDAVAGASVGAAALIGVATGAALALVVALSRPNGWRRCWLSLRAWLGSWPRQ
ncbi:hypothetical protein [Azospirillum isscasi]|uniref:Uncharacterized protein n=1 Tax=Azospirillum isscasi TaxID=3053926 RepID=A0ABU0WME5_9PROT|nr:hypothetical protein [Azospirillum isscasi]MDQ2105370.1 hypothetical protein [Azospirillum isscasi]